MKNYTVLEDGRKLPYHRPQTFREIVEVPSVIPQEYSFVEVEVGCGSGRFISARALKYPERFFIGIDKMKERFEGSFEKLERLNQNNWAILRNDARDFLDKKLPPINIFHIYHPDPWPKKKHHKHRFFRSPDAKHWASAIVEGGELRLSTDQADYYEEMIAIIDSWKKSGLHFEMNFACVKRSGVPQSRFEEIFLTKNEPVYKAYFKRIS